MFDRELESRVASRLISTQPANGAADRAASRAVVERDPIDRVSSRLGDVSCANAHASALDLSLRMERSSTNGALLRLQQHYGNRYVGQVLDRAREGESSTGGLDSVERSIDQARGGGQGLDQRTRGQMESAFGADFSGVRIHTDSRADSLNHSLSARAFATGRDVFFRQGEYNPGSSGGRELLAHELTHVVQQMGDGTSPGTSELPAVARVQRSPEKEDALSGRKDDSARFEGDKKLEDVTAGAAKVSKGARGLTVTKLQQALVDLRYLPPSAVDGKFEGQTKTALLKFQKDKKITESGELDADTLKELNAAYDTRQPYVDQAKHDPVTPGTHALSATDKAAALGAMVPAPGVGAPSTFTEDLGPPKGKYGPRMQARLAAVIASLHKELHEDKKPLRADPAKNFHDWSALEAPAKAAKDVVDKLYGSNYGGAAAKPPMTHAGGNLIDQWDDEIAVNAGLTAAQQKDKARNKVWYLINSNCKTINGEHSAVPSAAAETAILTPIVDAFVSDAAKVQTMLDLDIGWEGAQLDGKVFLQRYKSTDSDAAKAKEANRVQMWELFHTCIHEYLHTLAHPDFKTWAQSFSAAGDETRYNTLTEGFCDFFTLNVRTTVAPLTVQATVEGPYANGKPPPVVHPGVYPSHAQAEQVVSIVGIKNAQRAYFAGQTKLMGSP